MSPYFFVPAIIVIAGLLILWWRWKDCRKKNGIQPQCATTPCNFIFAKCSFWTGKPIADNATVNNNQPPSATNPKAYSGGFKWDATEKKCYGIFANGRKSWVNDNECVSRGLI